MPKEVASLNTATESFPALALGWEHICWDLVILLFLEINPFMPPDLSFQNQ